MSRKLLPVLVFSLILWLSGTAFAVNEPLLLSPTNGATAVSPDNITCSWLPTVAVDAYRLQFSLSSSFSSLLFNYSVSYTGITTTSRVCSGLPGTRVIYWRVVAMIGFNQYPSTAFSFTTATDYESGTTRILSVTSVVGNSYPATSASYATGTTIDASNDSIYIPPDSSGERYLLLGWTGTGSVPDSGTTNLVSIVLYRTSSLLWNWKHEYLLAVSTDNGLGVISFLGTAWRIAGSTITITNSTPIVTTGNPAIRWISTGWNGTGSLPAAGTNLSVVFTLSSETTLNFTWVRQFKLTIVNDTHAGNPVPSEGENWFAEDSKITFRVAPVVDRGGGSYYVCLGWIGYGVVMDGSTFTGNLTMTEPGTIIWQWGSQYDLVVNSEFGKTSGNYSGTYDEGVSLSATCGQYFNESDNIRYECRGWTASGSILGGDGLNTGTFKIYSPTVITWVWFKQYLVTVSSNHGATSPSGSFWSDDNSFVNLSAFPPADTSNTRYFWVGWQGTTIIGDPVGNLNETFVINAISFFTAIFRIEYLVSVSANNGSLAAVYNGWYPESSLLSVTSVQPVSDAGFRYVPGWSGTGNGAVNCPAAFSTPTTVELTVNAPLDQRSYWVREVGFEMIVPQGLTETVPPVGTTWYSVGTVVQGYAPFDVNGLRCTGFVGEGSIPSSSKSWFSFVLLQPSKATFTYEFPAAASEFSWMPPATVASYVFGKVLAVDRRKSDGSPVIIFHDTVEGTIEATYYLGGVWYSNTIDTVGFDESWVSLTIDSSDIPHVLYYDTVARQLKYAFFDSNLWRTRTVDPTPGAGRFNDIAVNRFGNIFVTYYNIDTAKLYFARSGYASAAGKGEQWAIETVDASANVGMYCSIAVSELWSEPHIAYYDSSNTDLKYAVKPFGSAAWQIETVVAEGDVGVNAVIVVDSTGRPSIACQSNTVTVNEIGILYIIKRDEGWTETIIDANNATGFNLDMVMNADGNCMISYHNYSDLYFALYNGQTWSVNKLTENGMLSDQTSIGLDSNGDPGIVYWSDGDLLYRDVTVNHFTGEVFNYYQYSPPPVDDTNVNLPTSTGGSGGCFVATAAFGVYSCNSVLALTAFRDSQIAASQTGNYLVSLYYACSPRIASSLGSEALRVTIQRLLVK